nr:hypothetical protein [Tanacetum cinerariifolium]
TNSEVILYSLSSEKIKESANEPDDANDSDMDLSDDNLHEDNDVAGIHHWEDSKIDFFKAKISTRTKGNVYSDIRIKSLVRIRVKKNWGIDQRIPFTMFGTHKGVVYLNQHNIKSFMKLSEVKKFCYGSLIKIHENLVDMVKKNKMGTYNKQLKGRDWTDVDVEKSN